MFRNRSTALIAILGFAALIALGAWFAGSRIESPADVAARTAPPPPSPILVPIEQRVLSSTIVTRGTARFGLPVKVSLAPSPLKAGPGLIGTLPLRNSQIDEGSVLLTSSGRPVFVLRGALPAYRDLVPGIAGDDVRQLEQALARMGFSPGAVDGVYDQQTATAVARWYQARKWEPFGATRDQLAALATLERDEVDAQKAKLAAAAALTLATLAVDSARASADHAHKLASTELSARQADARRLSADNGAPLLVEAERAKTAHADTAAAAELAALTAERALIVLDPRQPATARAAADARLDLARAALRKTRVEGELSVMTSERDARLAADQLGLAEAGVRAARLEGQKTVQGALDARRLAELDARTSADRADTGH